MNNSKSKIDDTEIVLVDKSIQRPNNTGLSHTIVNTEIGPTSADISTSTTRSNDIVLVNNESYDVSISDAEVIINDPIKEEYASCILPGISDDYINEFKESVMKNKSTYRKREGNKVGKLAKKVAKARAKKKLAKKNK